MFGYVVLLVMDGHKTSSDLFIQFQSRIPYASHTVLNPQLCLTFHNFWASREKLRAVGKDYTMSSCIKHTPPIIAFWGLSMALQFNAPQDLPSSGFLNLISGYLAGLLAWGIALSQVFYLHGILRIHKKKKTHITIVSRIRKHYTKFQVPEYSIRLELRGSNVWRNIIGVIK